MKPSDTDTQEKIVNVLAHAIKEAIVVKGIKKEQLVYKLEPEAVEWARLHAQFFLERYKDVPQEIHWTEEDERNNYIGMIGHKIFDLTLTQYDIFRIPNDPVLPWKRSKPYDFKVLNVGTIEVKTVDYYPNHTRLLVKESEWHSCDWVVAIKLLDELPTKALIAGVATKKQVEEEFNFSEEGEFPCFKHSCYWRPLEDLMPAIPFIETMQKVTKPKP